MPTYSGKHFDPPAPVAYVTLRNESNGLEILEVPFLIDTGADTTLIPFEAANLLSVEETGKLYELVGFDGQSSEARVVSVAILFDNLTFRGEFLTIDQGYGIIGRNILKNVTLVLNGPKRTWERIRS